MVAYALGMVLCIQYSLGVVFCHRSSRTHSLRLIGSFAGHAVGAMEVAEQLERWLRGSASEFDTSPPLSRSQSEVGTP